MKKIAVFALAAAAVLALAGCGEKKKAESAASAAADAASSVVSAAADAAADAASEAEAAVTSVTEELTSVAEELPDTMSEVSSFAAVAVEEVVSGAEDADHIMSYAEFEAAAIDDPVKVETYVQAKQSYYEGKATLYTQSEDGAYFIYGMECSEEDYDKLVEGTKLLVSGYKTEWSGEVEIVDATYEILDGTFVAPEADATELLGKDEISDLMNQKVLFEGLTVEASTVEAPAAEEAAFLYGWDGSGSEGDDIYFKASRDGQTYTFVVETNLCDKDSDVYKAVQGLKVGDNINISAFLYWYEGPQPHVTSVEVTGAVAADSDVESVAS